jgi:hypothetical protein
MNLLNFLSKITVAKVASLLAIVATFFGIMQTCQNLTIKQEKEDLRNNLYQVTREYKDETGALVKEVSELRVSARDLKIISQKKDEDLNNYERKLKQLANEAAAQKTKIRNIESAGSFKTENSYAETILLVDTVFKQMPVKAGRVVSKFETFDFTYFPNTDSLQFSATIRNDIFFMTSRQPKKKQNGKEHFPNWGKLWGWDYYLSVKNLNDSSIIIDPFLIKVNTFKR